MAHAEPPSLPSMAPVRVPKAAELVAAQLRRGIVRGEMKDGEVLPPEGPLLERFGVSRPTLREAFRVLESESLIEIRRGREGGAVVRPPDGTHVARYVSFLLEYRDVPLNEVFDAAAAIEGPCVNGLARTRTKQDLESLTAVLDAESAAEDLPTALAAQQLFHHRIIELSGNRAMVVLAEVLRAIIDNATRLLVEREVGSERRSQNSHKGSRAHRRVVELIEARDGTAAETLWRKHLRETSQYIRQTLGDTTLLDLMS